ncbi:MAG: MFS transporter [Rhodocyclaceae bacterium]|nr:MFS transporter [Rhodocyclaceae bacterium]
MNPWRRIFAPFALGYFLSYLLRNANAVVSPELAREFALTHADLGLLTSAYLLAFGLFQLPLGLLLDRFGPRRVEAALLLVCALGCAFFAVSEDLASLTTARALIGLGLSACLMASFKAFTLWFPLARQPSLNAAIMAAGGLGAFAASMPLAWLLPMLGWRGIFLALAACALGVAFLIFTTPDKPATAQKESLLAQLAGLGAILKSERFWRLFPQTTFTVGGFMALQGLWALPYMTTVDGLSRDAAAQVLSAAALGMIVGFVLIALFVQRLAQLGLPPKRLLAMGVGLGLLCMAAIVADLLPPLVTWPMLGFVFSVGNLAYALLTSAFPPHLSGRANTALNLGAFLGAFVIQWAFGAVIDALSSWGISTAFAFRAALTLLLALQGLSWLWYLRAGK